MRPRCLASHLESNHAGHGEAGIGEVSRYLLALVQERGGGDLRALREREREREREGERAREGETEREREREREKERERESS